MPEKVTAERRMSRVAAASAVIVILFAAGVGASIGWIIWKAVGWMG